MKPLIDITGIPKNSKTYNGTTRKHGITYNNIDYMVKFTKDNDMSVYSEYIASNIIRELGIKCHEVALATYNGQVVNVIKDFTSNTPYSLHSFKDIKQSSEDTDLSTKEYTYNDVLYLMDKHLKMTKQNILYSKHRFWEMFICDAIIGNRDRHWGNWGYLRSNTTGQYTFAPLYDNGAGLFPGINKSIHQYMDINTRKKFLYDRIYMFPTSLFKIKRPDRSYRSNYADMFKDLRINKILAEETNKFREGLGYIRLYSIASKICSDIQLENQYKRFYIEIVTLRYMCIILRLDFNKSYRIIEEALTNNGY